MKYQLFSERCSGSNYLEQLLRLNLPDYKLVYPLGFKHWTTHQLINCNSIPDDLVCMILIRAPFDWLRGMHKQPWHAAEELRRLPFDEFIRAQWHCYWDSEAGILPGHPRWKTEMMHERPPFDRTRRYRNLIEMRSVKYRIWHESFQNSASYIRITQEEMLQSPDVLIGRIASLGKVEVPATLQLPKGYKGKMSLLRQCLFRLSLGKLGGYRSGPKVPLALKDIEYIRTQLDADLEKSWGYDIDNLAAQETAYSESVNAGKFGARR